MIFVKTIRIIDNSAGHLYSIKVPDYHDPDYTYFDLVFDDWNDNEWLFTFFEKNEHLLPREVTIDDAVAKVVKEAGQFEDRIESLAEAGTPWASIFKPLDNREFEIKLFQTSKARLHSESWLRLYAIRMEAGAFVITGGAIKLWHFMDEHSSTIEQKQRMKNVRDYFREERIFRIED